MVGQAPREDILQAEKNGNHDIWGSERQNSPCHEKLLIITKNGYHGWQKPSHRNCFDHFKEIISKYQKIVSQNIPRSQRPIHLVRVPVLPNSFHLHVIIPHINLNTQIMKIDRLYLCLTFISDSILKHVLAWRCSLYSDDWKERENIVYITHSMMIESHL